MRTPHQGPHKTRVPDMGVEGERVTGMGCGITLLLHLDSQGPRCGPAWRVEVGACLGPHTRHPGLCAAGRPWPLPLGSPCSGGQSKARALDTQADPLAPWSSRSHGTSRVWNIGGTAGRLPLKTSVMTARSAVRLPASHHVRAEGACRSPAPSQGPEESRMGRDYVPLTIPSLGSRNWGAERSI